MRFKSHLTEGILLKRYWGFLALTALAGRRKLIVRCPDLGPLQGCDLLGTRIWFSNPMPLTIDYLPTWEVVEVDGGHLVGINPEHSASLVVEGIKRGLISELQDYDVIRPQVRYGHGRQESVDIMTEKDDLQTYIYTRPITWGNYHQEGLYPETPAFGYEHLYQLMAHRQAGHRSVLVFTVQHNGLDKVRIADHIDPHYGRLLKQAMNLGVEVLAYRAKVTLNGMALESRVQVHSKEDILG